MKSVNENIFRFKKFSVRHDLSTMKVGTDAVLLGAWANVLNKKNILDVGTGSGVIGLMLAQRSTGGAKIDAIEKDEQSFTQAKENATRSPWPETISIHQSLFQNWLPEYQYDLIVCNPPFFSKSLLPPNIIRSEARHSITLTATDLLSHASRLLSSDGNFAVVLPFSEGNHFIKIARDHGLYIQRQLAFFSREGKPQERWLLEFGSSYISPISQKLILYKEGMQWSEEYRKLTFDFYLDR